MPCRRLRYDRRPAAARCDQRGGGCRSGPAARGCPDDRNHSCEPHVDPWQGRRSDKPRVKTSWPESGLRLRCWMNIVDPMHLLGIRLDRSNVEIHDHGFLTAPDQNTRKRLIVTGIDLLVRHEWRHVDEVPRSGFGGELQPIAPFHARLAADDIDDALDRPVMMRPCLRFRVDHDRAGPQFLCAGTRRSDRRRAIHPRGLRRIDVELVCMHDPHAVQAPFRCRRCWHVTSRYVTQCFRSTLVYVKAVEAGTWPSIVL